MSKMRMPKSRKEFENKLCYAFAMGMECAYVVDHYQKTDDENIAIITYVMSKEN